MAPVSFLLKKALSQCFMPLPVVAILLVIGVVLMRSSGKRNPGRFFIVLGTVLLVSSSYGFIADRFVGTLEERYPPLLEPQRIDACQDIKWIVVLGGGSYQDERLPVSSRLASGSLTRLLEGVRLHRDLPHARLILSGGAVFQEVPEGRVLADTVLLMGVRQDDIVIEDKSLDTEDQARRISAIVGGDRFILVTSAVHMPRSMAWFHKYGTKPIAAPTDFLAVKRPHIQPRSFFPGAKSLRTTELAIHEYVGLFWMYLKL